MGKKVGVVVVPFITAEYHFIRAAQTILSIIGQKSTHQIDLISIINRCSRGAATLQWFKNTSAHCEMNDRNVLARAWNKGIRLALERGNDYALVINLDLTFHSKFLENIVTYAEDHPSYVMWSGTPWPDEQTLEAADLKHGDASVHYNCFLVNRKLFESVGEFDEQFEPAYHEDMDMAYRMRLAGGRHAGTPTARFFHYERTTLIGATMEDDARLLEEIRAQMSNSMRLYREKWGGIPGEELFKTPYDK